MLFSHNKPKSRLIVEELGFVEEMNFDKPSIFVFHPSQVAVYKAGLPQIGSIPDSIPEIAINEVRSRHTFYPTEIGTSEISIFPLNKVPFGISEVSVSHDQTTEVNLNSATSQINPTEVNTSEKTFAVVPDHGANKISLSRSIKTQQFLSTQTHLFTLALINTYKRNPVTRQTTSSQVV